MVLRRESGSRGTGLVGSSASSASGSKGKRPRSKEPSVKPATPLSPGRPAPPRSATPASVLNAHKLVGGATRVVMLKHRDNAPRPAVSFGGKSVSAVAMLVGGGLELPLPLYCVDDVSKALVDLRPEGAPALSTANLNRTKTTTRIVHDLLRDQESDGCRTQMGSGRHRATGHCCSTSFLPVIDSNRSTSQVVDVGFI